VTERPTHAGGYVGVGNYFCVETRLPTVSINGVNASVDSYVEVALY